MTAERDASRASCAHRLSEEATSGRKTLLLAPLGAGKSHTLRTIRDRLRGNSVPFVLVDLFSAASTPESLLAILGEGVAPYFDQDGGSIESLVAEGVANRHDSPSALLRLLGLLSSRRPTTPFVWLVDEVTEIRSLAYFPGLGHIEAPFAQALGAAGGAVLASSYPGLAKDLFPGFGSEMMQGLTPDDLTGVPSLRSDSDAVKAAIEITSGAAATLLPLVADMRDTRDLERSLNRLLQPGGAIELTCRRQYEVLLLRSRGYAVSKRAAEAVAASPGQRLTDLCPAIGRTPGASRQYLRWLVEVGLLTQIHKRYDFGDPMVGLWAGLYLGRGGEPSVEEIGNRVARYLSRERESKQSVTDRATATEMPRKRMERLEEID